MILIEKNTNLLDVPEEYYLVHCISMDLVFRKGLAKKINNMFNISSKLDPLMVELGEVFINGRVISLIASERYYSTISYINLVKCMVELKDLIGLLKNSGQNITKLAMPRIGCGYGGLDYEMVKTLIQTTFKDEDIEILICSLEKE